MGYGDSIMSWKKIDKDNQEEFDYLYEFDLNEGCGRYNPFKKEYLKDLLNIYDAWLYEDDTWKFYMLVRYKPSIDILYIPRSYLEWDYSNNAIDGIDWFPIWGLKIKELVEEAGMSVKYLRFSGNKSGKGKEYKKDLNKRWKNPDNKRDKNYNILTSVYNSLGLSVEIQDNYYIFGLL